MNPHIVVVMTACLLSAASTNVGHELAEFQYNANQPLVTVPVRIAGVIHTFVLDTAATSTVYDTSLRKTLGDPVALANVVSVNRSFKCEVFAPQEAHVGLLDLEGPVICLDMRVTQQSMKAKINGIIGLNFLRDYILQIDPDHATVRFLSADTPSTPDWGTVFDLRFDNAGAPLVATRVNEGDEVDFLIDIGNAGTGVFSDHFLLPRLKHDPTSWFLVGETHLAGIAGTVPSFFVRPYELRVGHFTHHLMVFRTGSLRSSLGWSYFSRYTTTFDFPRGRIHLKPGSRFADYDYGDLDGFELRKSGEGRLYASKVFRNTPAAKSGLRMHDVIVKVDGRIVGGDDYYEVYRYLKFTNSHDILLLVERGGERKEILLRRKKAVALFPAMKED